MSKRYVLYTMHNSPYSDKVRALLRYKRLPVDEQVENAQTRFSVLQARTGKTMVPVVLTPAGDAVNDSTTIAATIEAACPQPPTRWKDPVADTLAMLLEDYADEWLVRIMLCSRWYHADDAAQNATLIACAMTHSVYGVDFQRAARDFPASIVATLPKMGATPDNAESWYAMLPAMLAALDEALSRSLFLTGSSPHQCDFAFYGQLNQLRRDPTGSAWIGDGPASVRQWLDRIEGACAPGASTVPSSLADLDALRPLAVQMAETYLRMQVANALAVEAGHNQVRAELAGAVAFSAAPAKYNSKLLGANLDLLETLYAAGRALPTAIESALLAELGPLAAAQSALLAARPALARRF
ncbi:MAG: glutathione S-transferase [Deltaproteobacteria bacterium]|nr:glutathione S-transferase [Deltaproteobacteria bacterium]